MPDILADLAQTEPLGMAQQLPIVWDRAYGAAIEDINGKSYIDFTSGIFTANVGHSHPAVMQAISDQLDHGLLHTYTFPSASRQRLCRRLTEFTGYEKAYLCSTGSEAVEAALRIARGCGKGQYVIATEGAMHGKTYNARMLSEKDNLNALTWTMAWPHDGVFYPPPGKFCIEHNLSAPWLKVCAVILESYHGWGALFYPKSYVQEVAAWCKETGALLIFDEVQAGFGRTGKLFAYEHYEVEPDLVCCGKGLGAGLPIAAVLGSKELLDSDDELSSTHSGNPVCCAAALASIDVLESEGLVGRAADMGELICDTFLMDSDLPLLGAGLVWAVWMSENPRYDPVAIEKADMVVELAAERGLLLLKTGAGTVKIGPPLMIERDTLLDGLQILQNCIEEVC